MDVKFLRYYLYKTHITLSSAQNTNYSSSYSMDFVNGCDLPHGRWVHCIPWYLGSSQKIPGKINIPYDVLVCLGTKIIGYSCKSSEAFKESIICQLPLSWLADGANKQLWGEMDNKLKLNYWAFSLTDSNLLYCFN